MILYKNASGKLNRIKEERFKLEKDLQNLIEKNLSEIMNLTLVKSEFSIKGYRFDTLAYDEELKSFVIIEYKKNKSQSVVDQGFTYLKLMLDNKAEFVLEINERLGRNLKRNDIDWSQTRVVFVASSFNDFQKQSVDFKDIAIELWEVKLFEHGLISVSQIKKSKDAEGIKDLTENSSDYKSVQNEIKIYTEEDVVKNGSQKIQELYYLFKESLLNMNDSLEIKPTKLYIAFKKKSNICDIEIQKNALKIYLNAKWGNLDDPKHLFENISNKGHWGNGDYRAVISDEQNLEYIMSVIKQLF